MKYHMMTTEHKPEEGSWGDCHRVVIASLLGLEPAEVPHFYDQGIIGDYGTVTPEDSNAQKAKWLADRGLVEIYTIYDGSVSLRDLLSATGTLNPGVHMILGGESKTGCGHSVLICDGEIVHDPSHKKSGIVGPMSDGYYWVTVLGIKT